MLPSLTRTPNMHTTSCHVAQLMSCDTCHVAPLVSTMALRVAHVMWHVSCGTACEPGVTWLMHIRHVVHASSLVNCT